MNKEKLTDFLGGRNFWKRALVLAIPIALQNMLTSSFTLVDTLMVGQLGDVALSSVGMAGQWSWLLNMVTFGIGSGSAVFVSQYWGANDKKSIRKVTGIALFSALIFTMLFLVTGACVPEFVIKIFNRTPEIVSMGSAYLKIASFSYPGVVLGAVLGAILRSCEEVKIPVYSAAFTTLANAFLDYALIFGKFGFPEMGIEGAALATCISAWLGPVTIIIPSFIKKNILYGHIRDFFDFDKAMIVNFAKKATPVVCNESFWGLGTVIYNVIFANMGYENFAAVTIAKTVENLSYVFFIGLCNACCVMVGTSVGGGHIKRAIKDARRFSILIPLSGIIIGSIILIFRNPLVGLFNLSGELTENTVMITKIIFIIYSVHLPVRTLPYAFIVGVFRSGGDTVNGAKIDLFSLWGISIPITAFLAFIIKAPFPVVFAAMYVCEDYIKCILCIRHFLSNKWLKPVTEAGKKSLNEYFQKKQR